MEELLEEVPLQPNVLFEGESTIEEELELVLGLNEVVDVVEVSGVIAIVEEA